MDAILTLVVGSPLAAVFAAHPVGREFFVNLRLPDLDETVPLSEALARADPTALADFGLDTEAIVRDFCHFLQTFATDQELGIAIQSMTIRGGHDKSGAAELAEWTVAVGDIISIVGPTGAGKSRLLADIECLADGDTPTRRHVLLNGRAPSEDERFALEGRLVAQLSQNMNFVMDLTVAEFLEMHATSRLAKDVQGTIARCFDCANELAGEKFSRDTKVTQLSGGQSRALMIADTAYMSASPIVLIDEIENAGIDRRRALELLAREEKIVLISTHDPLLALSADKRIVIGNGGVAAILETSAEERQCLTAIEHLDTTMQQLRQRLRAGARIDTTMVRIQEGHNVDNV